MRRYRVIYLDRGVRYIQSDNLRFKWVAKIVTAYWNAQYRMKPYAVEEFYLD